MAHFSAADAKGQGPEGAVRTGVAITTDHGLAGLGRPQFGSDHVHDTAVLTFEAFQGDTELVAVVDHLANLPGSRRLRDNIQVAQGRHRYRRRGVIHGGQGQVRATHRQAALTQDIEGLRRGDFVDQVQVDVQHRRVGVALRHDYMVLPDFFEQCLPAHG
jgi:hypothetical protein